MRVFAFALLVTSCAAQCVNPPAGFNQVSVEVTGQGQRSFAFFVPQGLTATQPVPAVFAWHGLGGNGAGFATQGNWNSALQAEEWLGIFPDGAGGCHNGGGCCFCGQDDIAFTRAMVEYLVANTCLDLNRVFSSGFSNGGFMSHRLGCQMDDVFSAIGPHAGVKAYANTFQNCNSTFPVAIMHTHGSSDLTVPYNGNILFGWPGVNTIAAEYINELYECGPTQTVQLTPTTSCQVAPDCRKPGMPDVSVALEFCRSEGLGHTWTVGQNGHPDLVPTFISFFQRAPLVARPMVIPGTYWDPKSHVMSEPVVHRWFDSQVDQAMQLAFNMNKNSQ